MGYKIRNKNWNYTPGQKKQHRVSRTKIDFFGECPRCFYIDQRFGIARPRMASFTLNLAVDTLMKKEFDIYREKKEPHPLMEKFGIDAIPFQHKDLETWRENFTGITHTHEGTGYEIFGAVDDIWVNKKGELIVVDYKATSKDEKPTLEGRWGGQYKRQMDVYQWLLKQNGFKVSDTGYFVYVNGDKSKKEFDAKLEFDVDIIPYEGNTDWIDERLMAIKETLESDEVPQSGELCEFCPYRSAAGKLLLQKHKDGKIKK
ncbi:PD-(D/E)XK nuclease family protein [Candidatus Wolfebacteria bacterium]|nr:PD-(D/E)XK nuclease family protein [Candidatus Wolfebacteria bacterium]